MDFGSVRGAYSVKSEQYIALVEGGDGAPDATQAWIRRHLAGLSGPVFDLGCGPGHWSAFLRSEGADVTGVDLVPEFVDHARKTYPDVPFRLGSMTDLDVEPHSLAGILSWYSTIHLPPSELPDMLARFRRLLAPAGMLVVGFFDSPDGAVAAFDHKVHTAYHWPVDVFAEHLAAAGLAEVERLLEQFPDRPDRRYASIAARAS